MENKIYNCYSNKSKKNGVHNNDAILIPFFVGLIILALMLVIAEAYVVAGVIGYTAIFGYQCCGCGGLRTTSQSKLKNNQNEKSKRKTRRQTQVSTSIKKPNPHTFRKPQLFIG